MELTTQQLIEQRAQQLCITLTDKWKQRASTSDHLQNLQREFELHHGRKYYRIHDVDQSARTNGYGGAVHAFIDKQTGYVYKPASYKAPAKHVRYKLLDDESFKTCLENSDVHGSYLYMN